jgi:thiol:disulfide interchange protein DsbD
MKKLLVLLTFFTATLGAQAQLNPVSWTFSAKKIDAKTYEIHLSAAIQPGWHMYSQNQPGDAIAIPTTVTINNNPLLVLDGKVKELGKMEKYKDAALGVSANQYANKVEFVQVVKLKAAAKTNFAGNVEFQTCDDKKCLPPKTVSFNIALK